MPLELDSPEDVTSGNKVSPVNQSYSEIVENVIWPRDPTGWVFLGRAVHGVGRAMFPAWKRYTPYGLLPDVAVGTTEDYVLVAADDQTRYANWLINKRGDDPDYIYRTNLPFEYLKYSGDLSDVSDEEWELACDLSHEEWAVGLSNRRMFDELQLRLVKEAEAGAITFGVRPLIGGEPKVMPRDWWFTDRYSSRFSNLTFNPADPFSESVPTASTANHIFVKADDLSSLLERLNVEERVIPAIPALGQLSPYVRLMMEVNAHLSIDQSSPPKKASILHEIEGRWTIYDLPPSANLMDAMATLLRSPQSQAGRGRKS